jgi:hypothetical protein
MYNEHMFEFFKKLITRKKKEDINITVTVNGENVSDLSNERLSELFKELSNQFKPGRTNSKN